MSAKLDLHPLLRNLDLSHLPIGVYAVTPEGCFVFCNEHVRRLLQLPLTGPITKKIGEFYARPEERDRVLTQVLRAEAANLYFEKQILHFKVAGRDMFVQNNCRSLRDTGSGEIIGFAGSLVDVTEEHRSALENIALNQSITDLTTDIGRVLHANSSTLMMVYQALDNVLAALGANPFQHEGQPTPDEVDQVLQMPTRELSASIEDFLRATPRRETVPAVLWEELEEKAPLFRDFVTHLPIAESRANTLRVMAKNVQTVCERMLAHKLAAEPLQKILRAAESVERISAMVSALNARTAVMQMEHTIRSLREFVVTNRRHKETRTPLRVRQLIEAAHKQLAEFAHCSRVKLRFESRIAEAQVLGIERDLVRALANLLHNSIKYSWHRDRGRPPWVTVRTFRRENECAIAFENWGVAIGPEEIEEKLIFKIGYRGQWSKDRGRLGTGIGLTDALDVAQKHGGTIEVESRPARVRGGPSPESEEFFEQPFKTTVTMFLPEAKV